MLAVSHDNTVMLSSHITGGSEGSLMGSTTATFTRSLSPTWIQDRAPVMLIQSKQFAASHPTTCLDSKTLRSHLYCEILKSYLFTNSQKCHNDHQHESVCRHLQAKAENKYLSVLNRHLTNYSETARIETVRNLEFGIRA